MSQPHNKNLTLPEFRGQSQTMFYTEGKAIAVLITRKGAKYEESHPRFATAGRALAWCRKQRAGFIYIPPTPNN